MTFRSLITAALLTISAGAYTASATPIAAFTNQTITTSSQSQMGRLSRNNQPQTWTGAEPFPGIINTANKYYYNSYTISGSNFLPNTFFEISLTDNAGLGAIFISAYRNYYDPTNPGKTWAGDLGYNSVAYGTADSLTFQVQLHSYDNLVFVVTNTGTGTGLNSGLNNSYDFYVNGYTDTMYDDADVTGIAPAPEPSTFVELGTGLLAMAGVARRRFLNA